MRLKLPLDLSRVTGYLVLGLLSRNYLLSFTSCLVESRVVTDICDTSRPEADEISPG